MPAQWKIVGTSHATKQERDVSAYLLEGDVSTLTVPLAWPLPKLLELNLRYNDETNILLLWQSLVAQCEDPDRAGYVAFPATPEELHDVYRAADGTPVDPFPWDIPGQNNYPVPKNWATLLRNWYTEQDWYGQRNLVEAFSEAMESLTGIPLERSAPFLHSYMLKEDSGVDGSVSKPASTTTKNRTGPRSGRRATTSSPAA